MSAVVKIEELPHVPGLSRTKQRYTLDYGRSLIKLMYKDETDGSKTTTLKLAIFQSGDLEGLTKFIKKNVFGYAEVEEIFTTGMGISQNEDALGSLLDTRFTNLNEHDCFVKALKLMLPTMPRDKLFYPIPRTQLIQAHRIAKAFVKMETELKAVKQSASTMNIYKNDCQSGSLPLDVHLDPDQVYESYGDGDILPAIVAMCSSGFIVCKYMDHESGAQVLDYSPRGGQAFLGLGSLLTGAKSFVELMDLAAEGSSDSVGTYYRDLKGSKKEDLYGLVPDDSFCFSFGKTCGKDRDDFSRADLAASVVKHVCSDLAQLVLNLAVSHKVKNVILCGTLISHKVIQEAVSICFLEFSLGFPKAIQPKLRMCTMGPYLGVIGAWVAGMEDNQTSDSA